MKIIQNLSVGISALLASTITSLSFAAPVNVTVSATADNDFIVLHTTGAFSHSVKLNNPTISNFKWGTPERKTFKIDDTRLKNCYIDIIAWNDHTSKRGLAAKITGNAGTILSGNHNMKSYATKVANPSSWSGNYPNMTLINQILNPGNLVPSSAHVYASVGGGVWGNLHNNYLPSSAKWIWPAHATNNGQPYGRNFTVYRTACNKVVKAPSPPPLVRGEHYQCYKLEKTHRVKPETIMIQDQFGRSKAVLGRPRILCNPSLKVHNRKTFKIRNHKRHLVCYDIIEQERHRPVKVEISNQFEYQNVVATKREMFCVPSYKKHLDRVRPRPTHNKVRKVIRK